MVRLIARLTAAAFLTAHALAAQDMPASAVASSRAVQFGFGGGAIVPRNNTNVQEILAGATGQAFLLVRMAPGFPSLRVGADFSRMKFGKPQQGLVGVPDGSTRTQLGGIASLRFDLLPGPVKPYLMGGVGAFNIRDAITNIAQTGTTSVSSTKFGIDGGGGVSFQMGRVSGFVETRIQNVYTKSTGVIDTKSIQAFPITFGLMF
jgi:opacity protein-like surface antigen